MIESEREGGGESKGTREDAREGLIEGEHRVLNLNSPGL